MIAKVRIAAMEYWCETAKKFSQIPPGTIIPIVTESCFVYSDTKYSQGCGGKGWVVERSWSDQRHRELGLQPVPISGVCEHMLEMD